MYKSSVREEHGRDEALEEIQWVRFRGNEEEWETDNLGEVGIKWHCRPCLGA